MRKLTSIESSHTQPNTAFQVVGRSHQHESAEKQVSGEAQFLDDYATPRGCLHAAVVTSAIAKGQVSSVDLSAVSQADGVVRVLTADDIPGEKDIGTIFKGDPLLMLNGEIRYFGQPIALVLATSHELAWKAARLANVEYTKSDNVTLSYAEASLLEPLLARHQMGPNPDSTLFDQADIYLDGDLHVGGQEHFYLEGQASLAELTEDGGIFLRSSTQNPSEVQKLVAEVLAVDFNRVTVDMRRMGGGFGGKESQAAQWACMAALGAFHTKRAVKMRLPRAVDMTATGKRHPFYNRYQLAADQQGVIQAASIEVNGICGHSPDLSDAIVDRAMFHADNAYSLGKATVVGNRLKTDMVSHTAFRGFGGPQGMIVIEKAMQELALATGLDALDVRLNNLYRAGKNITPYGMEVEQYDEMRGIIEQLEADADYRARRLEIEQWNKRNPVLKKGLALTPIKFGIAFTATHLNQAGALIHIYTDGTLQVSHGGTEMGQGLHTKVQQIVAQSMGISLDKVLVTSTRTDKVPNTSPTAASSGADLNGMAAHNAVMTIKERLLAFAREHYHCDDLDIVNDTLVGAATTVSWAELVQQAYMHRVSLSASGFYQTPKIGYDRATATGRPFFYFSLGASCSEVTIDTLTGELRVDRVDILHDVGSSLNPAIDRGQIEGAFIQGLGWLTTEELVWAKDGRLLSNSPMNYKIPTIGDYPKQMQITLYDKANPEHSIYRSKAVGEPPFMHAISVWCAIYDAVASISEHRCAPHLHAPATGEMILSACEHQQQWLENHPVKENADVILS
ncbi:xanthine dehydrogenase molybdopterin binding subunit [Vibrio fluvialis]|uniref:xanthine dehydrogenase molybdopterin binding subunit n=1 Tax=Vibrio fluvialis TaxID=676 RepID=UPI00192B6079|nr:xanthine dehydrogenase molybdopterin binding subunit [Vibrio fluvialis]MBL4295680.1 xanthine dehydrogenase molybdopterin binding subunit [Vibrio fluvialis]WDY54158.1 xanthine dehydrogenase molybdopterin binding subunit [Vibrio fluvialis]